MAILQSKEYTNREISWLDFNERVLQEAADSSVPLIERMRFLGIFSNNLDEFFRVRVASIRRINLIPPSLRTSLGYDPSALLKQIHRKVVAQQKMYNAIFEKVEKELRRENIFIVQQEKLTRGQDQFVSDYFFDEIRPSLVPVMLTNKKRLPEMTDRTIYLGVRFKSGIHEGELTHAVIEVPNTLKRLIELPSRGKKQYIMFVEDIIRLHLERIFQIYQPKNIEAYAMKMTRDAELDMDDDISKSLVEKMRKGISNRRSGDYVRFVYDRKMPKTMLAFFSEKFKLGDTENVISGARYHNRRDLMAFPDLGRPDLIYKQEAVINHKSLDDSIPLIEQISQRDYLAFFPYHSFGLVVDFLREAAIDPTIKSIRITLYRVAKNSQIINALVNAARNGKKVVVIIEIQARFDERRNIEAAQRLKDAGAFVSFGVEKLKVHAKCILIKRKIKNKTKRFAFIGTGNFHEGNSKVYQDIGLFTANKEITKEVRKVFELIDTTYQRHIFKHLIVSPLNARRKLMASINKEMTNAKKGLEARIILKLNNLVDERMIKKLYDASKAGVQVDLIVRGICCLKAGRPGISENIKSRSIVGRYLEHARIVMFHNGGDPTYYISSSDWMTRNLDRRIEVSVPILDEDLKEEIKKMLDLQLEDNVKARSLSHGSLNELLISEGKKRVNSQEVIKNYLK